MARLVRRSHSSAKVTLGAYGHVMEEGHRLDRPATLRKLEEVFRGATRVLRKPEPADQVSAESLGLEPAIGLEPMTCALRVRCSTTELRRPAQA